MPLQPTLSPPTELADYLEVYCYHLKGYDGSTTRIYGHKWGRKSLKIVILAKKIVVFDLWNTSNATETPFEAHQLSLPTIMRYTGIIVVGNMRPGVVFMAINEVENHQKSPF